MNQEKESLKQNLEEILKNLPAELHADLKKQVEDMPDAAPAASNDDPVAAIKAELVANPSVDEKAAESELGNIKAPDTASKLTEAETEKEMAELLAEKKQA